MVELKKVQCPQCKAFWRVTDIELNAFRKATGRKFPICPNCIIKRRESRIQTLSGSR